MSDEKEPVGSVGEEALKLLAALQGWAKENGGEHAGASAEATAEGVSSLFHEINEHIATGGADCRYCPLCQAISTVRQVSPEVKEHLASAAASLMKAIAGAMATDPERGHRRPADSPVQKIDLSDEGDWEDDE